jgi:hypothetical protein
MSEEKRVDPTVYIVWGPTLHWGDEQGPLFYDLNYENAEQYIDDVINGDLYDVVFYLPFYERKFGRLPDELHRFVENPELICEEEISPQTEQEIRDMVIELFDIEARPLSDLVDANDEEMKKAYEDGDFEWVVERLNGVL